MNSRTARRIDTRNRIVTAARGLFSKGLYLSCSVDDIARAAGCSRTLFYKHFRDKEDVLTAVIDEQYDWWRHHVRALGSHYTRAGVIAWLEAFVRRFEEAAEVMHLLMTHASLTVRGRRDYATRMRAIEDIAAELQVNAKVRLDRVRHRYLLEFILQAEWTCLNMAYAEFEDAKEVLEDLADRYMEVIEAAPSSRDG